MASWKLYWIGVAAAILPFVIIIVSQGIDRSPPGESHPIEVGVFVAFLLAAFTFRVLAIIALGNERFTSGVSRVLTVVLGFFFPFSFWIIFLLFPNRLRRDTDD
ncbi:hypothetical protein [Botrimarina colliarenosi]|nr:hypothetical protein [Botrimarina colliarenosi]